MIAQLLPFKHLWPDRLSLSLSLSVFSPSLWLSPFSVFWPLRDGVPPGPPPAAADCCSSRRQSRLWELRGSSKRLRLGPRASLHLALWPGLHMGCGCRVSRCWWGADCHLARPSPAVPFTLHQWGREAQRRGTHPPAATWHPRLVRLELCLPDRAGWVFMLAPQGPVGPSVCSLLLLLAGAGCPPAKARSRAPEPWWLRPNRPRAGFERCAGHHRRRMATSDRAEGGTACLSVPAAGLLTGLQLRASPPTSCADCRLPRPVWEDTSVALQCRVAAGDLSAVAAAVGGLGGLLSVRERLARKVPGLERPGTGHRFSGSGLAATDLPCHPWIPHLPEAPSTAHRPGLLRHLPELDAHEGDQLRWRHPSISQAVCGEPGLWIQWREHCRYGAIRCFTADSCNMCVQAVGGM